MSGFPTATFTVNGDPSAVNDKATDLANAAKTAGEQTGVLAGVATGTNWTGHEHAGWNKWLVNYRAVLGEANQAFGATSDAVKAYGIDLEQAQKDMNALRPLAEACWRRREACAQDMAQAQTDANSGDPAKEQAGLNKVGQLMKRSAGLESEWQGYLTKAASIKSALTASSTTNAGTITALAGPPAIEKFTTTYPAGTDVTQMTVPYPHWNAPHLYQGSSLSLWPIKNRAKGEGGFWNSIYSTARAGTSAAGKLTLLLPTLFGAFSGRRTLFDAARALVPDSPLKDKRLFEQLKLWAPHLARDGRNPLEWGRGIVKDLKSWDELNSKSKKAMETSAGVAGASSKFSTWMNRAKTAGNVLTFASSAYDSWQEDTKAGVSDDRKLGNAVVTATAVTVGNIAGSKVGEAAGRYVGGAAGAAVGQAIIPIPGVGAAVGGAVGSTVGAIAGGYVGGKVGSWIGGEGAKLFKKWW